MPTAPVPAYRSSTRAPRREDVEQRLAHPVGGRTEPPTSGLSAGAPSACRRFVRAPGSSGQRRGRRPRMNTERRRNGGEQSKALGPGCRDASVRHRCSVPPCNPVHSSTPLPNLNQSEGSRCSQSAPFGPSRRVGSLANQRAASCAPCRTSQSRTQIGTWAPPLARAEEVARTAQAQVALRDCEPVGRVGHRLRLRAPRRSADTCGNDWWQSHQRTAQRGARATARTAPRVEVVVALASARRRPLPPPSSTRGSGSAGEERLHHAIL